MTIETAKLFRCILVAYDGTEAASHIVGTAMKLAVNLNTHLVVLGVVPPLSADAAAEGWGLDRELKFRPHLQAEMSRIHAEAEALSLQVATEIVDGHPDQTIEDRARQDDVDLLVVGHRAMSRVRHWFEGKSTAEGLVSSAQTAVLVIPEPDEADAS